MPPPRSRPRKATPACFHNLAEITFRSGKCDGPRTVDLGFELATRRGTGAVAASGTVSSDSVARRRRRRSSSEREPANCAAMLLLRSVNARAGTREDRSSQALLNVHAPVSPHRNDRQDHSFPMSPFPEVTPKLRYSRATSTKKLSDRSNLLSAERTAVRHFGTAGHLPIWLTIKPLPN